MVMYDEMYDRNRLLIGESGQERLKQAHAAVVGIGGVGSFVVEALARAGVGTLTLIDHDRIDITNLNRQLHATRRTIGQLKVEAMRQRIMDIDPALEVIAKADFILPENVENLLDAPYDYLIDACDTVTAKIALVQWAKAHQVPIICSMGTANKLDNTQFVLTDISKTEVCPLARVMRRELRARGIIEGVQVVYSPTAVIKPEQDGVQAVEGRRQTPGSISYVPGTAGLIIAGTVIQALLNK